jgi:CheY-like chemotaxis protein
MNPKAILHVDDDEGWRNIVVETLHGAGYQITSAESQAHAMELLRENQYHLLILDLSLVINDASDIQGMQILSQLFQFSLFRTPEIILLTGYCTKERIREAFRLGVADVMDKFDFDKIDFVNSVKLILAENGS